MDGYWFSMIEAEKDASITNLELAPFAFGDDNETRELRDAYYILCRNSLVPVGPPGEKSREVIQMFFRNALSISCRLAALHRRQGQPVRPFWASWLDRELRDYVGQQYPGFAGIPLDLAVDPEVLPRRTAASIRLSAFNYEQVRMLAIATWNASYAAAEDMGTAEPANGTGVVQELARCIVPLCISISDRMPLSRLPYAGALNEYVFQRAFYSTRIMLTFLISHEYGHAVLGHPMRGGRTAEEIQRYEFEADEFGIGMVRKCIPGASNYDIWISLRWLFQFWIIHKVIRQARNGQKVDYDDLLFNARAVQLHRQFPLKEMGGGPENMAELLGTAPLMHLKAWLANQPPDWWHRFTDWLCTPKPAYAWNWWEDIK